MRILITGGCGFLGSHLVEHFLKHTDWYIIVLDKLTYASNGFDRLRAIGVSPEGPYAGRVSVLGCDLSYPVPDGVAQEIGDVDYIIHAAAESHVDNSIVDPLPFLQSNVIGTHNLLMLARKIRDRPRLDRGLPTLERVFLVSTDEVYGPAPSIHPDDHATSDGFDQDAPFRPANPYAAAKAGGEMVGMAYANTYKLPVTIVNTMNLIGERQHAEKFVPLVIRKVLLGEKVTIHADPTQTISGTRFYLHCRTFANALHWLIDAPPESTLRRKAMGERYDCTAAFKIHVCGEREISNLHLAQMIADMVGRPLHFGLVDFHSSRPGHDLRYAMDDSLIRQLGWVRPMNLEESLENTVAWYLRNRHWLGL